MTSCAAADGDRCRPGRPRHSEPGHAIDGLARPLVGGGLQDHLGAGPDEPAEVPEDAERPVAPTPGVVGPDHGVAGHRAGAQVTLDLEALAVQDLPLLVRDLERRERVVDRAELGRGGVVEAGRMVRVCVGRPSRARRGGPRWPAPRR